MSSVNPYASSSGEQPATRTSKLAIASLVCGLLAFATCLFTGIPAIVLGIIALLKIGKSRGMLTGQGLAIAGLITGGLGTLATCVGIGLMFPALNAAREKGREMASLNNMRGIASAMLLNEQSARQFPGNIVDKNGVPLLSWRVRILPLLDCDALYQQFHRDEPWDSEHNRGLIAQMPPIFEAPGQSSDDKTQYLLPVGEGTIFEGMLQEKLSKGDHVESPVSASTVSASTVSASTVSASTVARADGLGATILLVEAAPERAVIWTKPEDLSYRRDDPGAGLNHRGRDILVGYADGRVKLLKADIQPSTLRKLFSFDGRRFHEPALTEDELHP